MLSLFSIIQISKFRRNNLPEVFLGKGVLKVCSKCTGKHPWRSTISIKLQSNFIEVALRHRCYPVNLLHIFGTTFYKNTYGGLLTIFMKRNQKRFTENSPLYFSFGVIYKITYYTKLTGYIVNNQRKLKNFPFFNPFNVALETSQLIYCANNLLAGFYMRATLAFNRLMHGVK